MILAVGLIFYQIGIGIFAGFSAGMFVAVKYLTSAEFNVETKFGKLVVRGRNNTVTDAVDITDTADIISKRDARRDERRKKKLKKQKDVSNPSDDRAVQDTVGS